MSEMTIKDLRDILVTVAGTGEEGEVSAATATIAFEDLGYDSLALMELAARIEQDYGVRLGDDVLADLPTPAAVLDRVNRELARGAA